MSSNWWTCCITMPVCTTTDHSHCYVIMIQVQYRMDRSEDHWLVYLITGGCWSTSSHALITLLFSGVTLPDERALQFCSSFHRCLVLDRYNCTHWSRQFSSGKCLNIVMCICDQMGIQLTAQMKKRYGTCESCFIFKGTVHQIIYPFWLEGSINHQNWKNGQTFRKS